MMDLQPGQNISITRQSPAARTLAVHLSWEPAASGLEIDSSAFALTAGGKVRGDEDFIFYSQPELAGGGIRRAPDGQSFTIDLQKLPAAIERIALTLTIHQGKARGQSFSQLRQVRAEIRDARTQTPIAVFPLATGGMAETAIVAGELYRRNQEWKFRALGQGFVGGLGPLAETYGVDVADDPDAAAPPPPPTPVRLSKITLEKKGQTISLEKGRGFEAITVNLNWSRRGRSGGGGLFGRMLAASQGIDLDLGCLFQLKDGRSGAIQALGSSFGQYERLPYIQLMGDDRTGDSGQGETLRINGRHWDELRKVLIFAFIYEGVPNWAAADAVVTITTPGQPALEVRLDEHRNDRGMCAIALLENQHGDIRVSKRVEYFLNHEFMDRAFGFGLRWVAGSKD